MPQTKAKIKDLETRLMRALADYSNLEKRHQNQRQDTIKFANATLLEKLLPILDDLYRAQDHLQDSGLALTINHFNQFLVSEGVSEISALNQDFDPLTMDCVQVVKGQPNRVVTVLNRGYLYHDKVLRSARVEVGSGSTK